jgi:hypothetical protein
MICSLPLALTTHHPKNSLPYGHSSGRRRRPLYASALQVWRSPQALLPAVGLIVFALVHSMLG